MMKLKEFWIKYENKIVLTVGLVLVAVVSFEFGLIQGKKGQNSPLIIEKAPQAQAQEAEALSETPSKAQNLTQAPKIVQNSISAQPGNVPTVNVAKCAYVGSKNSDKFYPPTCSYAKRIKPENVVCFQTAQEALAQGRTQSTGCK